MFDPVWESISQRRSWGKYPAEALIRVVARDAFAVPDRGVLKALELGCGPGANLWFLANEGIAFDVIDGSATAVARGRERLNRDIPRWKGNISVGDVASFPRTFRNTISCWIPRRSIAIRSTTAPR